MADKYCAGCGPDLICDCESPLMVHQCGFGRCGVEIYNKNEFCERHEADGGFLARGGPVNIVHPSKVERSGSIDGFKVFSILSFVAFVIWAGWIIKGLSSAIF